MSILIYDNTFEGFLSAVFEAFVIKNNVFIVNQSLYQQSALAESIYITADTSKSDRVIKGIQRLSRELSYDIYLGWISREKGIDNDILDTLKLGFDAGKSPLNMGYYDCVKNVNRAIKRVGWDIQRAYQFVRFTKINDDLYAADYEPDYPVLPLIADHFHQRFSSMSFIIRDTKHRTAIASSAEGWKCVELNDEQMAVKFAENDEYTEMWRSYFKVLSNPQRKNLKLQRQFVPSRYRKHLPEFE